MIHLIKKFHPKLRQILQDDKLKIIQVGNEQDMKELWDASNPDMPHEMRSSNEWKYPIENWFGAIVNDNGKARLVTVVGNAVRTGKEKKPYAYFGGAKTHPDYRKGSKKNPKGGIFREVRDKALEPIKGMPRIAGFSTMRTKSGLTLDKPKTHEVIPDDVLMFMNERITHLDNVDDWGISKWMLQLRK